MISHMDHDIERQQLPSAWKSERLMVRDAIEKDLPELRKVYDECSYIGELTGYHDESKDPMLAEFRGEALPPNGKRELQRLQSILESRTQDIIGYLVSYHGFPDHETFWIAALAIRPEFQRQKFGNEVISSLAKHIEELGGYSKMGIAVGVGNDPAMKFWSTCGFTEVIKTEDFGAYATTWIVKKLEN